jgi:carboxylesterase type B
LAGYTLGSSETVAPGNALVYQSQGSLIYVSIQYRLGAYGFLGGAEVTENGVANAGLLDQRAALLWVQRHISQFGGDPSKVTIIGGSAGGGSVTDQMILYGGVNNPPFRAVIAGSFHS